MRLWKRKEEVKEKVPPREIPLRALTAVGWVSGNLHLPGIVRVVDFISHESYLVLTDVQIEGDEKRLDYFALHRSAIVLLEITVNESLEAVDTLGFQDEHHVTCWIDCGAVWGVIMIRLGGRLSDFLVRHEGVVVVRECGYRVRNPLTMQVEEGTSWALLVNAQAVVGVTEGSQ